MKKARPSKIEVSLSPFDAAELSLPDEQIGRNWLGRCFVDLALKTDALYYDPEAESFSLPPDFIELALEKVKNSEAYLTRNVPFEKAFKKALSGDFETAGRLVRECAQNEATNTRILLEALNEREKGGRGPKAGGAAHAEKEKLRTKKRNQKMVTRAKKLSSDKKKPHELIGIISKEFKISSSRVRTILAEHGLTREVLKKRASA